MIIGVGNDLLAEKNRFYIDEVGTPDMKATHQGNNRYLSLTGIIMGLDYVSATVFPALESLKATYFSSHPDDPIIFHRKEMVNKKPPFEALRDEWTEMCFNEDLLTLLRELDYTVITAVIDKEEHFKRYTTWRFDPYHYCMTVLVERYVRWLERHGAVGDVMAESRGGNEDRRLKISFERIWERGTDQVPPDHIRPYLTSKQLKVKQKSNNISGLQLADLIAHPCFAAAKASKNNDAMPENFGGQIAQIIREKKYDRSTSGRLEGWGVKWLP